VSPGKSRLDEYLKGRSDEISAVQFTAGILVLLDPVPREALNETQGAAKQVAHQAAA
jgi:hypothetical protein